MSRRRGIDLSYTAPNFEMQGNFLGKTPGYLVINHAQNGFFVEENV
jgi:hypothetical protein